MAQGPKDIRIVCGLGNPGKEYELTRHSIGFAVVDRLAVDHGVRYWKSEAGCQVASIDVKTRGEAREVLLAKPQDFMNTSGGPLSKLARAHHVKPAEILVVHDEVDLPAGSVAAKWGGGLNAAASAARRERWMSPRTSCVSSRASMRRSSSCLRPTGRRVSSHASRVRRPGASPLTSRTTRQ